MRFGVVQAGTAAAATITAAIALGGFVALDPSPTRISASDVESAHERMLVKEQLIQEIDTQSVSPRKRVPRGFEAAKGANVSSTRSQR
jgi:hypothetical protein